MLFLSISHHYLFWHYSRAFMEIFHVWLNLLWFVIHFFSLPQLMRSWISPWKRIVEGRGEKWNLEDLAGYIIIGLVSRIIGFILRTVVITIGLFCLLCTIVAGFAVYAFWIAAPLLIIALVVFGVTLLFA
ncbi:hypothetical protein GW937_01630 [Candidatus Kaiserbacteria bacterium]|nr:hypothetical protein [Candidatus Kaiserbacteria bacterium]NCT01713.1 hypothetical protein [Candidatus Parcubacteria bacterium]